VPPRRSSRNGLTDEELAATLAEMVEQSVVVTSRMDFSNLLPELQLDPIHAYGFACAAPWMTANASAGQRLVNH
jgi:hypothetical protein